MQVLPVLSHTSQPPPNRVFVGPHCLDMGSMELNCRTSIAELHYKQGSTWVTKVSSIQFRVVSSTLFREASWCHLICYIAQSSLRSKLEST